MFACCNNLRGSIHYSDMPAIFLNTIAKNFNHIQGNHLHCTFQK